LHRFASLVGDHLRRDTVVDDRVVVLGDVVVDDRGLVVDDRDVGVRYMVAVQPAMPQVGVVAVGEMAVAKPEMKTEAHAGAVPHVANPEYVVAAGRQRCPAAV